MANYHLAAKIISRSTGRKAVAAAAYRRAARMYDERYDMTHDYSAKKGVVHSELSTPEHVPEWLRSMQQESGDVSASFWNYVEQFERRKDARLAREVEFSLPVELTQAQGIALAKAFIHDQFVSQGMVADWSVHWDNPGNPHVHCLLTTRPLSHDGFGKAKAPVIDPDTGEPKRVWQESAGRHVIVYKRGDIWGSGEQLEQWREQWAKYQNFHLQMHGHSVRVDHRSYAEQGLSLPPTSKIGVVGMWMERLGIPSDKYQRFLDEKATLQQQVQQEPMRVIEKLSRQHSAFHLGHIERELSRYLDKGSDAFNTAMQRIMQDDRLVAVGEQQERMYYSLQSVIAKEQEMVATAGRLSKASTHPVVAVHVEQAKQGLEANIRQDTGGQHGLSEQQQKALDYLLSGEDVRCLVGVAGAGKSTILSGAKEAWEASGYRVRGGALSGVAASGLEDIGITSSTLHSLESSWRMAESILDHNEGKPLTDKQVQFIENTMLKPTDVLVIDEAGMVGAEQLGRVMAHVEQAGAKLVLVGDDEQLQSIEAGKAFKDIRDRVGSVALNEVRRQREAWQKEATQQFATERTAEAIQSYLDRGSVSIGHLRPDLLQRNLESRGVAADEVTRILTVAEYRECRAGAGKIWHDAQKHSLPLDEHPDYARFEELREKRNALVQVIAEDAPSHVQALNYLGVDREGLTADILSQRRSRVEAMAMAKDEVHGMLGIDQRYEADVASRLPQKDLIRHSTMLQLADDYMQSVQQSPEKSRLVMAFTRKDVKELNRLIQGQMIASGRVARHTQAVRLENGQGEAKQRYIEHLGVGDRVMFRENSKALGVMNGTIGRIDALDHAGQCVVRLDSGREVAFSLNDYKQLQLGYAATVHKAQGVTVDQSFVLASRHFDKHLTYVAMSRHKDSVRLYASESEFRDTEALKAALSRKPERYSVRDFSLPEPETLSFYHYARQTMQLASQRLGQVWQRMEKAIQSLQRQPEPAKEPRQERLQRLIDRHMHKATQDIEQAHGDGQIRQMTKAVHLATRAIRLAGEQVEQTGIEQQAKAFRKAYQQCFRASPDLANHPDMQTTSQKLQRAIREMIARSEPELKKEQGREKELGD